VTTRNENEPTHQAAEAEQSAVEEAARTAGVVIDKAAAGGEELAHAGADVFRRGLEITRDNPAGGMNTAA